MAKLIDVDQVESGKNGVANLGERLTNTETSISTVNDNLSSLSTNMTNEFSSKDADIAKVNETVMAMASAPVTTPIFNDVEISTILAAKAEVTTISITGAATADGSVQVSLNGGAATPVAVTNGDSAVVVAGKVQVVVDALADYTATVEGAVVTVTAVNKRSEVDATFSGSTTGVTGTVTVSVQGVDGVDLASAVVLTIPESKTYKVGKGNLMVLRNGVPQVLQNSDYTEASATTVQFPANVLKDKDVVTFIIGNASKLNYNTAIAYYADGDHAGKIQTVTYTGDIARVITYTYNAGGKIATEAVQEDGKTTTKTFTYDGVTGKLTGVSAVVA